MPCNPQREISSAFFAEKGRLFLNLILVRLRNQVDASNLLRIELMHCCRASVDVPCLRLCWKVDRWTRTILTVANHFG